MLVSKIDRETERTNTFEDYLIGALTAGFFVYAMLIVFTDQLPIPAAAVEVQPLSCAGIDECQAGIIDVDGSGRQLAYCIFAPAIEWRCEILPKKAVR